MVRLWEKTKKKSMNLDNCRFEDDINTIEHHLLFDPGSDILQGELKNCLVSRGKLLLHKEETLRQKSRDTWLLAGDENSHYFHHYANKRRVTNAVWEAVDEDNTIVFYQASIKKVARNYFTDLYKELDTFTIEN